MAVSAGTVAMALLGSFSPLFTLLAAAGVLYLSKSSFRFALRDIKARRYFSSFVVGAILLIGMLISGHVILSALAALLGDFLIKIIERAENNAKKQLVNVFGTPPSKVWLKKDGVEVQVDFTSIEVGDIVVISAGEVIPVDGKIQEGIATVDQHILTGESQPVEKEKGDKVFAATLMLTGRICIMVETAGQDTVAAKIGDILNSTQEYKNKLIARGQEIADTCLHVEMGISVTTLLLLGLGPALTILWSGLGATMMILSPISVLNYLQIISRHGILIKDGRVLESLHKVDTVIFDKTGTLTLEQPEVGKIHCFGEWDEKAILFNAAAAEHRQVHPIAKAILEKAAELDIQPPDLEDARYEIGYGIKVTVNGRVIQVGSARFMEREGVTLPNAAQDIRREAEDEGFSLIYVGINGQLGGILEMHPCIRPEAFEVIQYLKKRGVRLYIISGDHEHPTRRMAEQLGIDNYFAEVLPENKAEHVKILTEQGRFVCFIGDGINDSIALKSAQVSVSLQGASTAATDTAQIIFMDGTLKHLMRLFQLVDEFEKTIENNLLSSIIPGFFCIGSVYFLHIGVAAGMGLFYTGAAVGLTNTFLPLIKYQEKVADPVNSAEHVDNFQD
ncbi:MAG: heavy metal translocating P-type ATPase [Candidatus Electrothrix aestuarii]|uniref:Heavy metal translocating P-type ATPase n=1 Tax=Candidatus Electrothrix aestuarii TaxID=3062594 RepID=A0AAU8LYA7_9BACT